MILKLDLVNRAMDLMCPEFDALMDIVMLPANDNDTLDLMDAENNEEVQDAQILKLQV